MMPRPQNPTIPLDMCLRFVLFTVNKNNFEELNDEECWPEDKVSGDGDPDDDGNGQDGDKQQQDIETYQLDIGGGLWESGNVSPLIF